MKNEIKNIAEMTIEQMKLIVGGDDRTPPRDAVSGLSTW